MRTHIARAVAGLVTALWLGASTLFAGTFTFAYSGVEGGLGGPEGLSLTGGFVLDEGASRVDTAWGPGGEGINSVYTSPLHQVCGTLGGWTFSGIADIYVSDGPGLWSDGQENLAQDHWIARADVSGPTVNGLTPTHLNLFYYIGASVNLAGYELLPPGNPLSSNNVYDFQFNLSFSDAEGPAGFTGGRLFSIQSVPEPSTALLFGMALAVVVGRKRRK